MGTTLYEIWLSADGKHHDKYAQPQANVEALCVEYNCSVKGMIEGSHSRLQVELNDEGKAALIKSDLLEQLPTPGNHPAIFEYGTVKTQPTFNNVGLTA